MNAPGKLRILLGFLAGYFIASNLNWGIAEFLLNPWAVPRLDGFMRVGEDGAAGINIVKMTGGFAVHQAAAVLLMLLLPASTGWVRLALYASAIICVPAFYGSYTFLSGWGDVNWLPLMGAATADTFCIAVGCLIFGWIVCRDRSAQRA